MAFKKAKFGSKNPTGDKAFNKIAKHAFTDSAPGAKSSAPPAPDDDGDFDDGGDEAPPAPAAPPAPHKSKKPAKGKSGGKRYDTATQTFRKG